MFVYLLIYYHFLQSYQAHQISVFFFFYNKQIHINTHNFSCRSLDKIFRFLDIGCYYYNNNLDLLKVPELKFFARLIGINKLLFFLKELEDEGLGMMMPQIWWQENTGH